MSSFICILGRQPALGLAELESRFGAKSLQATTTHSALLETIQDISAFNTIGGTQKTAKLLTYLDTTDWNTAVQAVQKFLPGLMKHMPTEGKTTLGLSAYDFTASASQVSAAALSLKKIIKHSGRSARIVPNPEPALNTAQVIHNKLLAPNGLELILIRAKNRTILAQTIWIQNIETYRRRDQERPMRDARVGMLPPKLAQIILNLAYTENQIERPAETTVLDPFCGTGVLLQEAILNGNKIIGSDLDPRMVEYTSLNLRWLRDTVMRGNPQARPSGLRTLAEKDSILEPPALPGDATTMLWRDPFDLIASETYLGRALSSMPSHETLQKIIKDCDTIHNKFLKNVARQTKQGFRMCIAVPAWRAKSLTASEKNSFRRLPVLDHLKELGYNRVSFEHVKTSDLIYHRENQIVARELVVLTRI